MSGDGAAGHAEEMPLSGRQDESAADLVCEKYEGKQIINISHSDPDIPLEEIQGKLKAVLEIVRRTEKPTEIVANAILCMAGRGCASVDLVAHSTSAGQLLMFGTWEIRANDTLKRFCQRVRHHLGSRRVTDVSVRLIGCGTAGTSEGKKALAMMERELKMPVLGTATLVMAKHFSPDGYTGGFLVRDGATKRRPESVRAVLWQLPSDLEIPRPDPKDFLPPHEDPALAAFLERVFAALGSVVEMNRAFQAPGLLLQPLTSVVLPATTRSLEERPSELPHRLLRMDVLFDVRLLRIWPMNDGQGVIYQIRNRAALLEQLRALGGWFRPAL
jgi:hypothetical protein